MWKWMIFEEIENWKCSSVDTWNDGSKKQVALKLEYTVVPEDRIPKANGQTKCGQPPQEQVTCACFAEPA